MDAKHRDFDLQRRAATPQGAADVDPPAVAPPGPDLHALLHHPNLRGRGNGPVLVAALQRAQRLYGNRAVQRSIDIPRWRENQMMGPATGTGVPYNQLPPMPQGPNGLPMNPYNYWPYTGAPPPSMVPTSPWGPAPATPFNPDDYPRPVGDDEDLA